MPIKSTCLPTSIYGSYERWCFLGASIQSFDASSALGQEGSNLSVVLVEDPCPGQRKYLDADLNIQTTNDPDVGFLGTSTYAGGPHPLIGCPCIFRVSNFEMCGIIQSWEEISSISGNPTFRVNIVSPTQILEGSKLIIGEYSGGVGTAYNTFGIYGFLEQFSPYPCPQTYLKNLASGEGPNPSGYLGGDLGIDGAIFGTESGGFGGAYVNDSGIQWNRIKTALNILTSNNVPVSNVYSPYGRIVFYGTSFSGFGLCGYDRAEVLGPFSGHSGYYSDYILDLSELPNPGDYFRISGSNVSILDAINQVCEICSYDYYVELILVRQVGLTYFPSGIAKIIKVRAVSRASQTSFGEITNFVNYINSSGNRCIQSSVGRELRNETTTSFLIGGNKQTVYQIEQSDDPEDDGPITDPSGYPAEADDIILPYFGKDIDEDVLIPRKEAVGHDSKQMWYFYAPLDTINDKLQYIKPLISPDADPDKDYDSIKITENELLVALEGFDEWLSYTMMEKVELDGAEVKGNGQIITALGQAIENTNKFNTKIAGPFSGQNIIKLLDKAARKENELFAKDLNDINAAAQIVANYELTVKMQNEDMHAIYDWVHSFASQYYGLQFQVRIPYTCVRRDNTSGAILTSEECSDGGWTDQSGVIKLPNVATGLIDRFRTTDGRLGGFVRYDYNFTSGTLQGLTALDESDYVLNSGETSGEYNLWMKCEAEKDFVYLDKETYFSPRAIIKVPYPLRQTSETGVIENNRFFFELLDIAATGIPSASDEYQNMVSALKHLMIGSVARNYSAVNMQYDYVIPDAAAIPIKSNSNTYGPWVALGPAGAVRIDQDPNLVPWEYDGMTTMNAAALALVTNGLSLAQIEEMGEVTVPGYPEVPISAEVYSVYGGYYAGAHLVEGRLALNTGTINETDFNGTPYTFNYLYYDFGGAWDGTYGPNVTSINTQVGIEGVQTRYQFRTFTKKFGNMQKMNAERIKQMGKNRLEARRNLTAANDQKRKRMSYYGGDKNLVNRVMRDSKGTQLRRRTPHDVLIGQILPWADYDVSGDAGDGKRTSVHTVDMLDMQSELAIRAEQHKKAYVSLDFIFRPISVGIGQGSSSGIYPIMSTNNWAPLSLSSSGNHQGYQSHPPFLYDSGDGVYNDQYNLTITKPYLNPLISGHDIEILGRGPYQSTGSIVSPIEKSGGNYSSTYTPLALKGPLLLMGWGYDTDGFPIPNKSDSYHANSGLIFGTGALKYQFMDNWLKNPESWAVGPIDLRYDRARGVWTSPPPYRLVRAVITNDYVTNNGEYSIGGLYQLAVIKDFNIGINRFSSVSGEWIPTSGGVIKARHIIKDGPYIYPSGTEILCYYDERDDNYWIIKDADYKMWYCDDAPELFNDYGGDQNLISGYFTNIQAGSGISFENYSSGLNNRLKINSAIGIYPTTDCLLNPIGATFPGVLPGYCQSFKFGRGISAYMESGTTYMPDGRYATIDAGINLVGTTGSGAGYNGLINRLTFSSGPWDIQANDCDGSIEWTGSIGPGGDRSFDYISSMTMSVSGTPCPSGCGISSVTVSITYGKSRALFNQWGAYINSTGIGSTTIVDS